MRLLLDSQALIWFFTGDRRLPPICRRAIENARNTIFVSAASGYELALKSSRLRISAAALDGLREAGRQSRFQELPITLAQAIAAAELPDIHRDPWDRLLIAQARKQNLLLVSTDEVFEAYGAATLR